MESYERGSSKFHDFCKENLTANLKHQKIDFSESLKNNENVFKSYNGFGVKVQDKVFKITADELEYKAFAFAQEHQSEGIAKVSQNKKLNVEYFDIEYGKKQQLFLIERDYVEPLTLNKSKSSDKFFNVMEDISVKFDKGQPVNKEVDSLLEISKKESSLSAIVDSQIKAIENGACFEDLHEKNLGMKDNKVVCFDPRIKFKTP